MTENNDKAWFSNHIRQMKQTMFRVAYVILGNETDCEDATSSALLIAYEKLPQLRNRKLFRAWFIRILKNECYLTLRRRRRVVHLNEEVLIGYEMRVADPDIHSALMQLNKDYRLAIVLYYMEGYGIKEMASIIDVPSGTIKSRLSRARLQLKDLLTDQEDVHDE